MPGLGVTILETSNPAPPHHPPAQSSCQAGVFVQTVGRCQHNGRDYIYVKARLMLLKHCSKRLIISYCQSMAYLFSTYMYVSGMSDFLFSADFLFFGFDFPLFFFTFCVQKDRIIFSSFFLAWYSLFLFFFMVVTHMPGDGQCTVGMQRRSPTWATVRPTPRTISVTSGYRLP